jgi:hypothetical protein
MSPDDSKHVTKGGGVLAIPGRLSDRDLPIRMQRPSKERHEAVEAKEQRSRAKSGQVRPLALRLDARNGPDPPHTKIAGSGFGPRMD